MFVIVLDCVLASMKRFNLLLTSVLVSASSQMEIRDMALTDPALVNTQDDDDHGNEEYLPSTSDVSDWILNTLIDTSTEHEEILILYTFVLFLVVLCSNIGMMLMRR